MASVKMNTVDQNKYMYSTDRSKTYNEAVVQRTLPISLANLIPIIKCAFFTLLLKVGNILSDVFNVFNCTLHC